MTTSPLFPTFSLPAVSPIVFLSRADSHRLASLNTIRVPGR